MDRWPDSSGEAIHTSTFLGHPTACAAALASIAELREQRLVEAAASWEPVVQARLLDIARRSGGAVGDVRGCGLLWGMEFVDEGGAPDTRRAQEVVLGLLRAGVLALTSGPHSNVLALSPPLVITQTQFERCFQIFEEIICARERV